MFTARLFLGCFFLPSVLVLGCGASTETKEPLLDTSRAAITTVTNTTGSRPTALGGVPGDGTWLLTSSTTYYAHGNVPTGTYRIAMALRFDKGAYELAWRDPSNGAGDARASGTMAWAGDTLTFQPTEGFDFWKAPAGKYEFSSDAATFTLLTGDQSDLGEAWVFEKQ